jgi:uncharacterized protein YciI
MVIVELIYIKPLDEVEKHLVAHRAFLQAQYDKDLLLTSGPKNPRDGGIIVAMGSKAATQALIEADPFYVHGIAEYKLTEFDPVKCHPIVAELLS